MSPPSGANVKELPAALESYRGYLLVLAQAHIPQHLKHKFEPMDLVQQTLLDGHENRNQFRGKTEQEHLAWLRQILANNIHTAQRDWGRRKRDPKHERSLEAQLDASSNNLLAWLASEQSSPSRRALHHEEFLRLTQALTQLPDAQREALILRHCQKWSLLDISKQLGIQPPSVVGLLKRGALKLRELLEAKET